MINEYNLRIAFNSLDENQDGIITFEKLHEALNCANLSHLNTVNISVSDEMWQNMLTDLETKKDGQINFEDFQDAMMAFNMTSFAGSLTGQDYPFYEE